MGLATRTEKRWRAEVRRLKLSRVRAFRVRAGLLLTGLLLTGLPLIGPVPVRAQATLEWSTVATTTSAACGEGFSARVVQAPGTLTMTFFFNGKKTSEVSIVLAADGSGKAEASGIAGRLVHEVTAGTGKRLIKSSQVGGVCQWSWMPG